MKKGILILAVLIASLTLTGCVEDLLPLKKSTKKSVETRTQSEQYVERVNECIADGDRESAISIAETGIERTGDEELKKLYFSLTGKNYGEEEKDNTDLSEEKKEEIKEKVKEEKNKDSEKTVQSTAKDDYYSRAKNIEDYVDSLDYGMMNQHEINQASVDEYEKWDGLLNDVYQYLKSTLPASEFEALKEEQREN